MRRSQTKWLSSLGVVVLIGTLGVANYGTGVPQGEAQAASPNPLTEILAKLDQVLTAIGGIGGGGDGNHTLRWDQNLPADQRFVVLGAFANAAVLDKETGLVWEQSPRMTTHTWSQARTQCTSRMIGNRMGWRLPSVHELASLVDTSVAFPGPTLPAGHPFTNVNGINYWSATTNAENPANAWGVIFNTGGAADNVKAGATKYLVCARWHECGCVLIL